jgi:Bacterial Ig domain
VDLRPDLGVRVAVRDGRLTGVSVRPVTGKTATGNTVAGKAMAGSFTPGSRSWRTRWALAPSQTYRVTATAVGEQGISNVSHGCVNLAPGCAAWFYGHSVLGDRISVVGSPVAGTWGDGWTIYFLGWRKLLAGSATGDAVLVSRGGSRLAAAASAAR